MKVRVNMSELRRDIRGRTAEGKEWGRGEMLMRSRRAGAHTLKSAMTLELTQNRGLRLQKYLLDEETSVIPQ